MAISDTNHRYGQTAIKMPILSDPQDRASS